MSHVPKGPTKEEKRAQVIGVGLAAGVHLLALVLFFSTGFKAVYPPPAETGIEVNFEMEPPQPIEVRSGHEPRVENPNPE